MEKNYFLQSFKTSDAVLKDGNLSGDWAIFSLSFNAATKRRDGFLSFDFWALVFTILSLLKKKNGRSDRIRTYDPCVPNAVLYRAELHSDF